VQKCARARARVLGFRNWIVVGYLWLQCSCSPLCNSRLSASQKPLALIHLNKHDAPQHSSDFRLPLVIWFVMV